MLATSVVLYYRSASGPSTTSGQGACNRHRAMVPVHLEPVLPMSVVSFPNDVEDQWELNPPRAGEVDVQEQLTQ